MKIIFDFDLDSDIKDFLENEPTIYYGKDTSSYLITDESVSERVLEDNFEVRALSIGEWINVTYQDCVFEHLGLNIEYPKLSDCAQQDIEYKSKHQELDFNNWEDKFDKILMNQVLIFAVDDLREELEKIEEDGFDVRMLKDAFSKYDLKDAFAGVK